MRLAVGGGAAPHRGAARVGAGGGQQRRLGGRLRGRHAAARRRPAHAHALREYRPARTAATSRDSAA